MRQVAVWLNDWEESRLIKIGEKKGITSFHRLIKIAIREMIERELGEKREQKP
jgi:hypothetical protein